MSDNYALSPNDRKAQESYAIGTKDLVFLQIRTVCSSGNLETNYLNSDSNFQRLLQVLQQRLEFYGVGQPASDTVTVIVTRATVPYSGTEESNPGGFVQILRDDIDASPYFSGTDVFQGQIAGWAIENDC
jgi:hypothetical protein